MKGLFANFLEQDVDHILSNIDDWEVVMNIVEKIESIEDKEHGKFGVHIVSNSCTIQASKFRSDDPTKYFYFDQQHGETKIDAVQEACKNFINWYNKRNNENSK